MLKQLLLVGVGGGAGSMMRYLVSFYTAKYYAGTFPLATFSVNILGCLLIGFIAGILTGQFSLNDQLRLLLITGFCGGYTTFSTFAMENLSLMQYNNILIMCLYIALSVIVGIAAVWFGLTLGSSL